MSILLITEQSGQQRRHQLSEDNLTVGRTPENDLMLFDNKISRRHCAFRKIGQNRYKIVDLDSRNGIWLKGERVKEIELQNGMEVTVGFTKIVYFDREPGAEALPVAEVVDQPVVQNQFNDMIKASGIVDMVEDVSASETGLFIFVVSGAETGQKLQVSQQAITIGRHSSNILPINDTAASSFHAEIGPDKENFVLRDLGSTNGTLVNGEEERLRILKPGDEITIGRTVLLFGDSKTYEKFLRKQKGEPEADAPKEEVKVAAPEISEIEQKQPSKPFLRRYRMVAGVVLVLILVGLFAGYRWWFQPSALDGSANLININASFEKWDTSDDAAGIPKVPSGWKAISTKVKFSRDNDSPSPKQGAFSFRMDDMQKESFNESRLEYSSPIFCEPLAVYRFSSWIKTHGVDGFAAIRICWKSPKDKFMETNTYSPLRHGDSQWEELSWACRAPDWAESAEIACVLLGKGGTVNFDGLRMIRERAPVPAGQTEVPSPSATLTLTADNTAVQIDRNGVFSVKRDGQDVLWGGQLVFGSEEFGAVPKQEMLFSAEAPKYVNQTDSDDRERLIVEGELFFFSPDRADRVKLEITEEVIRQGKDFLINYRVRAKENATLGDMQVAVAYTTHPGSFQDGVKLTVGENIQPNQLDNFSENDVREVSLKPQGKSLVMAFDPPGTFRLIKRPYLINLQQIMRQQTLSSTPLNFKLKVMGESAVERKKLSACEADARRFLEGKDYSAALAQLNKLIEGFPTFIRQITWAKEERKKILDQAERLKIEVDKYYKLVNAGARESAALKKARAAAEAMLAFLPESEYAAPAKNLLDLCDKAENRKPLKPEERQLNDLLKWANEAADQKYDVMARIFAENVILIAPDSPQGAEAKKLLERLDINK